MDWIDKISFSKGHGPLAAQGQDHKFGFRRMAPKVMEHSHWHGHIEINYLFNCSAEYLINGQNIHVPQGRMLIFWASFPHQMVSTQGDGELVNIYIPLQTFLTWKLPNEFVSNLLHGGVIVSDNLHDSDTQITKTWQKDIEKETSAMLYQVISEIQARVKRLAIEDYSTFNSIEGDYYKTNRSLVSGLSHIQTMLRYIAEHYDEKITIAQVADSTGLHQNYAMKLFNRVMHISIKQYINQLRLQHAQALLIDTDKAVLNIALEAGFGSISRFYDIFQRNFSMSPLEFRRSLGY